MANTKMEVIIHYVAHVKIEKISRVRVTETYTGDVREGDRAINEVTQITVRADELNTLIKKLNNHLILVED